MGCGCKDERALQETFPWAIARLDNIDVDGLAVYFWPQKRMWARKLTVWVPNVQTATTIEIGIYDDAGALMASESQAIVADENTVTLSAPQMLELGRAYAVAFLADAVVDPAQQNQGGASLGTYEPRLLAAGASLPDPLAGTVMGYRLWARVSEEVG